MHINSSDILRTNDDESCATMCVKIDGVYADDIATKEHRSSSGKKKVQFHPRTRYIRSHPEGGLSDVEHQAMFITKREYLAIRKREHRLSFEVEQRETPRVQSILKAIIGVESKSLAQLAARRSKQYISLAMVASTKQQWGPEDAPLQLGNRCLELSRESHMEAQQRARHLANHLRPPQPVEGAAILSDSVSPKKRGTSPMKTQRIDRFKLPILTPDMLT